MTKTWTKEQEELIQGHIKKRQSKPVGSLLQMLEWDPGAYSGEIGHLSGQIGHPVKRAGGVARGWI